MYDAAYVWTHGVDGSVGAETCRVDPQVGGALLDHVPDDVDLHLGKRREDTKSVEALRISDLDLRQFFSSSKLSFF